MTEWELFAVKYYRQGVRPDILEQHIIETFLEYSEAIPQKLKLELNSIIDKGIRYGRECRMSEFEKEVNDRSRQMTKDDRGLFFDAALLGYLYGCKYTRFEPPKYRQVTAALSLKQNPTMN